MNSTFNVYVSFISKLKVDSFFPSGSMSLQCMMENVITPFKELQRLSEANCARREPWILLV